MGGFGLFLSSQLKPVRGEGHDIQVAIKKAIDPKEIMNPGKLLGMKTRFKLPVGPGLFGFGMSTHGHSEEGPARRQDDRREGQGAAPSRSWRRRGSSSTTRERPAEEVKSFSTSAQHWARLPSQTSLPISAPGKRPASREITS